jgi:hypothetical protein
MFSSSAPAQEPTELKIVEAKLGFSGVYKLGCWTPLEVVLQGGDSAQTGMVEAGTRDADGVPTTVFSPPDRPVGVRPGEKTTARLFVRVGQDGASLNVRFRDAAGGEGASRAFMPGELESAGGIRDPLPASDRVVVSFGMEGSLSAVVSSPPSQSGNQPIDHAVTLDDAAGFPLEWFGYEGVDAVVLGGARPELYRPLAASPQRIAALAAWVESGGQLVIFCGAAAPELIGPDGPLASLVPGEYDTVTVLRESTPLELFSGSAEPINRGRPLELQAARLRNTQGKILAYAGADPQELPLVVRARRGLGEVTFVGLDPDAGPMADWAGRTGLLRQSLRWPAPATASDEQGYGYRDSASVDMTNQLVSAMDRQFAGIQTAPFALVAALVIGYILLIGPGDYFFVKRVLKRMELTWITFPLIVLGVSLGAYWIANAMKGDQLRVNQVEIVDVDLEAGEAHGTVWTHFFSPRVDSYNLKLAPSFAGEPGLRQAQPGAHELVAWLGMPGYGIGGMSGHADQTSLFDVGYAFAPALDAMLGLPVQEWSTKSLVARWRSQVETPLEAELTALPNELVAGSVKNRTGQALHDCVLMHGEWAYELGALAADQEFAIDDSLRAVKVQAALGSLADGAGGTSSAERDAPVRLDAYSEDVGRIARTMMFYEALGGERYAPAPNRYQSFIDLSDLLAGEQAILLARVDAPGSQWLNGEKPLASDDDRRWVYYRFVIPLEEGE